MGRINKLKFIVCITLILFGISLLRPSVKAGAEQSDREVRAVWMATVWNLDWPSEGSYNNSAKQKQELKESLDYIASLNMNTVFFQVRSMGDAMYPSNYAPWSRWLTGVTGKNPGYDPLRFAVDEAHNRGLEFHAWFNPFRIDCKGSNFDKNQYLSTLPVGSPLKNHPEWIVNYGSNNWLDISLPEVRKYVIDTIIEVVANYNIDGVHLDDYFYPYPVNGLQFPDEENFKKYGVGYSSKDDWRRDNVNKFVRDLKNNIKAKKANVKFGISPFGIWDNGVEKGGSNTNGLSSYSAIYADSRKWVNEEMVDYIVPQIYWTDTNQVAPYNELVKWWSKQVEGKNVQLYIGQATNNVGQGGDWNDRSQITKQIMFNRMDKNVKGNSFFSLTSLKQNKLDFLGLVKEIYTNDGSNKVEYKNGWKLENGKWYYYNNNVLSKGWLLNGGKWYYLNDQGVMQTGWIKSNGVWYYLNNNGDMYTGWLCDGGKWYYLNDQGAMQTGWIKSNGKWYYLNSGGDMYSGWLKWNNDWYYLYPGSGTMAVNTSISGYKINSYGVWVR